MKKNFLLLFLMALLPLSGWAQNVASFGEMTFGIFNYGDVALPAIQLKDGDGNILTAADYETDGKAYSDEACTTEVAVGAAMEAGNKYYVKVTGVTGTVYEGLSKVAYFTVQKRPIVLTFTADALDRTYGESPVAVTLAMVSTTVLKYGQTLTGAGAITVTGNAPTYSTANILAGDNKVVTFTPAATPWSAANYEFSYPNDFTLDIAKKEITASSLTLGATSATYTGAVQTPSFTLKDADNNTIADGQYELKYSNDNGTTWTAALKDWVDGGYKVKAVPTENSNYTGESDTKTYTINKAPLTVYVQDISKEYNQTADPDITGAKILYSGLVGADAAVEQPFDGTDAAFSPKFNSGLAGSHTNVGSYKLKPVLNTDNTKYNAALYANYTATLATSGKVTVTPKTITIKPTAGQHKQFGEEDPAFTIDATAAFAADVDNVAAGYTVTRTDAGTETVGTHTDVLTLQKKADADLTDEVKTTLANYNISTQAGDFQITSATLYVYPKSVSVTYGDPTPTFEIATSEDVELTTTPTVKFKDYDEAPTDAGTYVLTLEGEAAATGYTVELLDGQYTINKKALTPVIAAQQVEIDGVEDDLDQTEVTFTGLVNNDPIGYTLSFATGVVTNANNTYAAGITIAEAAVLTGKKNANYTIDWTQTGKLIVGTGNGAAIEITDFESIQAIDMETRDIQINFKNRTRRINTGATTPYHPWKAGKWNALVLPFDIDVAELSNVLGFAGGGKYNYVVVNTVKPNSETGKFQFQLAMGTIPANTPIMVKTVTDISAADPTTDKIITFQGKTIEAPASATVEASAGNGFKLVGKYKNFELNKTTTARDAEGNALYKFMYGDDDSEYRYFGSSSANSWIIVPFDCYVDLSGDAGAARNVIFEFEEPNGNTTAITSISVDLSNASRNAEGWYNLNGLKLQTAPTQKGVYIKDGKKFIVK